MAEVNETKKPVKNRKKTVWLIVAGAVLAVMLLAALALFCPGVSLLRTPGCHAAARTGSDRRTDAGGHCRAGVRRGVYAL